MGFRRSVPLLLAAAALAGAFPARDVRGLTPEPVIDTYRRAAERGSVAAQAAAGALLLPGEPHAALPWILSAARGGDLDSQVLAAVLLRQQNKNVEAAYWYSRAADKSAWAAFALGTMYEAGEGVSENFESAARLYGEASWNGVGPAATRMGNLCMMGAGMKRDYARAREWYLRGAALGDADAFLNLAGLYYTGLGVERDLTKARSWALAAKRLRARDADSFLEVIGAD